MGKPIDMTGERHGSIVVKKYLGDSKWLCVCDCGKELTLKSWAIRRISSDSCRCKSRELATQRALAGVMGTSTQFHKLHGKTNTRLYGVWRHMISRCQNANVKQYKHYGGRGIEICSDWLGANGFQNFYVWAYGNGYDETAPKGQCTIDRIDVDGDYCPENCRWITHAEQMSNTRRNRLIEFRGETHTLAEWSRVLDMPYARLISRLNKYHWPVERAFSEGKRVNKYL